MAKAVVIASLQFPTKKLAKEFFRRLRDRYPDGCRIGEEDDRYLRDLIAIHPESETKVGCGISHFTVETEILFGRTRHFMIHRTDGSSTDVSFHSAIDGTNERRDRLAALRRGIENQIVAFKQSAFSEGPKICPLRGVPITEDAYHVDHTPPRTFIHLADEWLTQEFLRIEDVEITPPSDNQIVTEMTNDGQKRSWQEYHQANAILRLLSPLGNLSDAKVLGK